MKAELHVASPLVENREIYFARYCKEIDAVGAWLVVDVSLETIFPNLPNKCRRKPSGCLIQPLENGFSKVYIYTCLPFAQHSLMTPHILTRHT